jgi:hypothetical protein
VVPNQRTNTNSNGNSNGRSHGSYKNNLLLSCDWLFEVADCFVDLSNLVATNQEMNGDERDSSGSSSSSPTQQPTIRLYPPIFLVEEIPEVQVDTFFTTRKSAPMIQLEQGHSHRYMRTYSLGSAFGYLSASTSDTIQRNPPAPTTHFYQHHPVPPPGPSLSLSSSSTIGTIEISPGLLATLRGADETRNAIKQNFVQTGAMGRLAISV